MRTRLLCVLICAVLASSCGRGADRTASPSPEGSANASKRSQVKAAPDGKANRPKSGTYYYEYESESTNASMPDATPRRSKPDALLARKVAFKDDAMAVADRSTEGPAIAEVTQIWKKDRIVEIAWGIRTDDAESGCKYTTPVEILHFPIKKETLDVQKLDGEGNACGGERTVQIVGKQEIRDANGDAWSTWHIKITSVQESTELTSKSTVERWLSPDLGTDVKVHTETEHVDPQGAVTTQASSTSVLETYPT